MGFAEQWADGTQNRDTMNLLAADYMNSVNADECRVEYEFAPFHHFL
jgi:hypothetical protein